MQFTASGTLWGRLLSLLVDAQLVLQPPPHHTQPFVLDILARIRRGRRGSGGRIVPRSLLLDGQARMFVHGGQELLHALAAAPPRRELALLPERDRPTLLLALRGRHAVVAAGRLHRHWLHRAIRKGGICAGTMWKATPRNACGGLVVLRIGLAAGASQAGSPLLFGIVQLPEVVPRRVGALAATALHNHCRAARREHVT
mmetsp:Transcript_117915/g.251857  ORF Transcript_117915/g.251857 Transcript_117915/m.251857 type:complete len:200 (-) Transcript_117915:142-741(-)